MIVYTVVRFKLVENIPVFESAGIYGEFPLTRGSGQVQDPQFKVCENEGNDWHAAVANTLAFIRTSPVWGWLWLHLLKEQGVEPVTGENALKRSITSARSRRVHK